MSVLEAIREAAAKREASQRYRERFDFWATQEQILADVDIVEAAGAHQIAVCCLKAYRNELDNPPSPGLVL
jgi:hypothetical protein